MRRLLIGVFGVIAVAGGCATHTGLTAVQGTSLKGRQVVMAGRYPPGFLAAVRSKLGPIRYGGVGVVASFGLYEDGNRIVHDNAIDDPARLILRQLTDELAHRYGLIVAPGRVDATDDDPTRVAAANPSADLILDVWTDTWSVAPLSNSSWQYRVSYVAYLRLIDAKVLHPIDGKKGAVIAQGACRRVSEASADAPTYDQLVANGAARLKAELRIATRLCADQFRSAVFGANARP